MICKTCKKEFTPNRINGIIQYKTCFKCRIVATVNEHSAQRRERYKKPLKSKINKVSKSQKSLNNKIVKIKAKRDKICVICGERGRQLAHLLPKSCYPEYYTLPENLVIMCCNCHHSYDNNVSFRQSQTELYEQVKAFDEQSANRYFNF